VEAVVTNVEDSPMDAIDIDILSCELTTATIPIRTAQLRAGQLVSFFLMASYLYYRCEVSVMEDGEFDKICVRLDAEWNYIKHPHKRLIDRNGLSATTGYYIKKYPNSLAGAAEAFAKKRGLL
jgi:hypothetical protein